jgi:ribosomal protein S12 methylthiotransferase accessory factor
LIKQGDDTLDAISTALALPVVHKAFRQGSHRSVEPAETIERVRPLMPKMGITRIANVTGLDRIGIPVVMVCRPNSRSIAVSQGKGIDNDAATASGLMEAAEIYHAEHVTLTLKLASFTEMSRDHRVIDIALLPKVQGNRYHSDLVMLWIEGFDLIGRHRLWLPFEMVRANYTLPLPPGSGCFDASTNGLASGNHILEAVSHGLCEIIERDANTLWNRLDRIARDQTQISLDTIDDGACCGILQRLEATGFDVTVWETTSDTGVPAFFCVLTDTVQHQAHIGVGSGCHPARNIALSRALTEAVQVRTTYISGARDDLMPAEYGNPLLARRQAWARQLKGSTPARAYGEGPDYCSDTFNEDVTWLLQQVRQVGIGQVVAVNLTQPGFDLPVVRMVVPGLEGPDDHDGYVPGERALQGSR